MKNHFDRIRIGFQFHADNEIESVFEIDNKCISCVDKFNKTIIESKSTTVSFVLNRPAKYINIFKLTYNQSGITVLYDFSAKILEDKYLDGISKENINVVIEYLNKNIPGIKIINSQSWLKKSKIYYVEIGKNISLSNPVTNYLYRLYLCRLSSNFRMTNFSNGNFSIRRASLKSEMLTFYDKNIALQRDGLSSLVKGDKPNILRIELKLSSFMQIRSYFKELKKGKLSFDEILDYDTDLLSYAVDNIIDTKQPSASLAKGNSANQALIELGLESLQNLCQDNQQKIRYFLLNAGVSKTNVKRDVDKICKRLNFKRANETPDILLELISKINC